MPMGRRELGKKGEDIACMFLMKHGYRIVDRNYWKKWGEIDIIANTGSMLCFIEVKSVSRVTGQGQVTYETGEYRAEDNLHPWKLQRLSRTIQSYLLEKGLEDAEWRLDAVTVLIDQVKRTARVEHIKDIIIE